MSVSKRVMKFCLGFTLAFGSVNVSAAPSQGPQTDNRRFSYQEVHDRIFQKALSTLPFYSRFSLQEAFKAVFRFKTALMERAGWTVANSSDLMEAAPKVLHPMGVCAEANWEIDTETAATGLMAKGTKVPAIVRLSVANNDVVQTEDSKRVIAIALKLFPTQDKNQKVSTANFLTADHHGLDGSLRKSFFSQDQQKDPVYFSNFAPGSGFAAKLGFILFDRVDGPSNFRPLYPLAEVTANNEPVERAVSPTTIHLVPRVARKLSPVPGDFREEIRSFQPGEIIFDVVIPKQVGVREDTRIGRLTLGKSVVSVACDQELHFHHHPMNRKLNNSQTSMPDLQMNLTERAGAFRYRNGPKQHVSSNGWEHKISEQADNPLFHEVKYFNFSSPEISGAMTYLVMSPVLQQKLVLQGNFVVDGKMTVLRKDYDLSCVEAAPDEATASFCREGGFSVDGPGRIRTVQTAGNVQWDLSFDAPQSHRTNQIINVKLDETLWGAEWLLPMFDGHFHWVPTMRSARATGWVQIGSKRFSVDTEMGYHDQHYGVWNPMLQPMRWSQFTGRDSKNSKVEVMLAEFPGNSDKNVGLWLHVDGKKVFWPQGSYKVEVLERGTLPLALFPNPAVAVVQYPIGTTGSHGVDQRIRITTIKGLRLSVEIRATTGAAAAEKADSSFVLDEQMANVNIQYDYRGEARSAQGPGFWMKTSVP